MSTFATIEQDAVNIFKQAAAFVTKAKTIWVAFSSTQNRALALQLFADAIKVVNASVAAAQSGGVSIVLDEAVLADINQIINDAKAGNPVIVADLALLGITL
jgi:hypothetical protein